MSHQLTIRRVPDEIAEKLREVSKSRGQSINSTVLGILHAALGVSERRERLERYATWEAQDSADFEAALKSQRAIDADLWE